MKPFHISELPEGANVWSFISCDCRARLFLPRPSKDPPLGHIHHWHLCTWHQLESLSWALQGREVTPAEGKPSVWSVLYSVSPRSAGKPGQLAHFTPLSTWMGTRDLYWQTGYLMTTDRRNSSSLLTVLTQPELENPLQGFHH